MCFNMRKCFLIFFLSSQFCFLFLFLSLSYSSFFFSFPLPSLLFSSSFSFSCFVVVVERKNCIFDRCQTKTITMHIGTAWYEVLPGKKTRCCCDRNDTAIFSLLSSDIRNAQITYAKKKERKKGKSKERKEKVKKERKK